MIPFDPHLAARLRRGTSADVLRRAFRLRAGLQGAMAACQCAWPLVRYKTSSEHAEGCQAHWIVESAVRAGKVEAGR